MERIEELLLQRTPQSIIEIGQILEKFYNGQAGTIFRAIVNGHIKEQISNPQDNSTSADRRLGRAEGIQMIQDDIELAIEQMHSLSQPQEGGQDG
jgi:hypothetical protein